MKSYEETAAEVLSRRDAYKIKTRRKVRSLALLSSFCLIFVLGMGVVLREFLFQNKEVQAEGYREKRNVSVTELSTAIIWPWDELEIYEKYFSVSLNGTEYILKHTGKIPDSYVGKKIGDAVAIGYDEIKNEEHKINCEVFGINNLSRYVAVKYEGYDGYYLYMENKFLPPKTLGQFIEEYNLKEYLPLTQFYYTLDGKDKGCYYFSKDIWNMLLSCSEAPFEKDYTYYQDGEDIGFFATSEALGIENRSFQITADGYIVTNIADYGYNFHIGTDAARKIIDYVYENRGGEVIKNEEHYLVGTVTELGEDYIKVDDSIMMKNPDDGIVFTVYATTNEFKRYLKNNILTVGELVQIKYDGSDDNGVIKSAISIADGVILVDEESDYYSSNTVSHYAVFHTSSYGN